MHLEKLWQQIIKKAKGRELGLIIAFLFLLSVAVIFGYSNDFWLNIVLMLLLAGAGIIIFYIYSKHSSNKRKGKSKRTTRSKTVRCPRCTSRVIPTKIGDMYICPECSHEFRSLEKNIKLASKGVKLIKELD